MELAGRASEPAGRASEPAGRVSELAGKASEPAGRALCGDAIGHRLGEKKVTWSKVAPRRPNR